MGLIFRQRLGSANVHWVSNCYWWPVINYKEWTEDDVPEACNFCFWCQHKHPVERVEVKVSEE